MLTDLWASKDEPQAVEEGAEEVEDDTIVESSASSSTSTEPVTAAPVTTTAPRDTPLTDVADTNNMESPTQAPKSKTQPPSPAPTPASNTASTIDMSDYNLDDLDLLQNGDNIASMDGVNGASQQVLYFLASSCMLAVGFLGWVREQQIFHIWMVQGALFGVLSALSMTISDFGTLILRTLSVHCFLVEAIFLLWLRSTLRPLEELKLLSYALWAADLFFAVGTIVQIALVYWLHFSDGEALYELNYADGDVFSSWCWGISAMLHLVGTVYLTTNQKVNRSIEESLLKEEENEDGERYSIQHGHHVTNVVLP